MAEHTIRRNGLIIYCLHLVFHRDGKVRVARARPRIERDERSMELQVSIPEKIFDTPTMRAEISIPIPEMANLEVEGLEGALRSALGIDVDLKIIPPDDGK